MISAQGNSVLILPDKPIELTKGGLAIPRSFLETPQVGTVVDCGPACQIVRKGCKVHFAMKYASLMKIDEVLHCFTKEEDEKILYVYD